jgi:glycerophosphoryl diester phosphodiesterase
MSGKRPRLKWHMLRRKRDDPPFLRSNLVAGLEAGAALEVDLVLTADGHFVCLHDLTLDAETTGTGPVASITRADLMRLRQRGAGGAVLEDPPPLLDEMVATVAARRRPDGGLTQLDMKDPPERLDDDAVARLRGFLGPHAHHFIAGSTDAHFLDRLRDTLPELTRGFDPLALYGFGTAIPSDAAAFIRLADDMVRLAPHAAIYYLEADLVLAGLTVGVDLVARAHKTGAEVDAWTVDTTRPAVRDILRTLLDLGADQITTNEPDMLRIIIEEIV